ncbi:MAG TPA: S8 family serine peptidase [Acidimicrobiales bacterium]|nr:S8 family serine peptidase [Acidimicrobiales bacterium]
MSSPGQPAWAKESIVLRMDDVAALADVSPEWAFAGATGAGVRVAIIDSGIDADHPALGDSVDREGSIEFTVGPDGAVRATLGPHDDVFGHGTACAGIIHALAPEARITSVRVLGPRLTGKAAAFHAGLAWAVDEGFDVINLSLGTTKADWALPFHEVCDRAYFGGSFIVTAANNVARVSYPSLFASVASVACNTATDPLRFHVNPEPPTEFLARGIDVEVPWLDGGTTTTTGNSFAAPHIAGLAALIRSKHPALRPFQVKSVLWATAANTRGVATPEAAGRRGTMMATSGVRGTAMHAVRDATSRARAEADAAADDGRGTVRPRRRSTAGVGGGGPGGAGSNPKRTGESTVRDPPPRFASSGAGGAAGATDGSGRVDRVGDIEVGPLVGRWRWGAIRTGTRMGDGRPVRLVELGGSSATPDRTADAAAVAAEIDGWGHRHLVGGRVLAEQHLLVIDAPLAVVDGRPVDDRLAAGLAAVRALAELHRRGRLHGDLGRPWLTVTDTGVATVRGAGLSAALGPPRAGTGGALDPSMLAHLAPEQLGGDLGGPPADVYSAALLMTGLVTGRSPFPDEPQMGAFLRQRLTGAAPSVGELGGVPGAVAAVLDRCLAVDPSARPADGVALEAALVEALATEGRLDQVLAAPPLAGA